MHFKTLATITALLCIGAGLGFALQEFSLTTFFAPQTRLTLPLPTASADRMRLLMLYSSLSSFVYMFGAALFGCGLLAWAMRNLQDAAAQTNAALALFGMNAVLSAMALQQQSVWRSKAGWVVIGVCLAQAVAYGWLLLRRPKVVRATATAATEPGVQILREQWAQQIHEAAAQQERNRLARELHDSIKQQLFSINVNAATVQARWEHDEAGARTALEAVRSSVREAMAEMEAMLHNLRPAPLETVGLVEAVRQQCEALQYRTGAQVVADIGELPANQELPAGTQDALFRIVQEALANIARHARASNVRVRLRRQTRGEEDALWLKIEDDGGGFEVSQAAVGMGLANIRSRVFEIGGALQLESREGEGTSLTVCVPLTVAESHEIRRDLRIAFVFTLVGFLVAGSWILVHTRVYWPLIGLSIFALSGLLCYRAAKAIRQMKVAGATTIKQLLELQGQLRQVVALLLGALLWSLENWHLIAEYWHVYIPNETLFLTLWPLLTIYGAYRVHQNLRAQAISLTREEFLASLRRWWKKVSVVLGVALLFLLARPGVLAYPVVRQILIWQGYRLGLTTPSFQPLRAFWLATLVLLLYWLYLAGWQLWLKRRKGTTSLAWKGNYDPSGIS